MTGKLLLNRIKTHMTLNNGVLFVALLIAGVWVWSTVEAIQRNFKLQRQLDTMNQEIALHELQNKTLRLQKKYYESQEYIELSARERLNKVMPGEKLLILPPNTVQTPPDKLQTNTETPITERSNFAQWMYFLFGKKS